MSDADIIHPDGDPGAYGTLILGIGNVLYADEGFGVRAVEALNASYTFPESVRLMDGGTQGIFLLPWVRQAERLLIFDAVDFDMEPATLKLVRGDDVPCYMGAKKVSMHQAGFQEVLSSASLSRELPGELALVGVQPVLLDDYGGSLTREVRARIGEAVELACEVLRDWGVEIDRRGEWAPDIDSTGPEALNITDYELGRPHIEGEAQ